MGKSSIWWTSILLFLAFSRPGNPLILPPDPFDATDRYALIISGPDGFLTQIQARIKPPGPVPLGPGELVAEVRYKLPSSARLPAGTASNGTPKTFYYSVSLPVPIQSLAPSTSVLMGFDFSNEPISPQAFHRSLTIYFLPPEEDAVSQEIVHYPPERLLWRSGEEGVQHTQLNAFQSAVDGELLFGPWTFLRERGVPQTETLSFEVTDGTGVFMLRLRNGDSQGDGRVAAAWVTLNGQQIFRPSEFNKKVGGLNRQVVLQNGENTFQVKVRGKPGTHLTLELFKQDGQVCRALGPHTFIRATGKPVTEEIQFSLGPQLTGPFTLRLTNGEPNGSKRVDSGTVTLNGQVIYDASRFNEQVAQLSQTVDLQSTNTLRVQLKGAPGDRLTLEITGFDHTPPEVTITNPLPGAVFSGGPVTVTGVVDDPSATVTVNGIVATVAPDGTFTAEGVPLEEGENVLTVVATDSCGNQGEDQISVHLQTTPVGPELILCAEEFFEQVPEPPGQVCALQAIGRSNGLVVGLADETAVAVSVNDVLFPDGVEVFEEGPIFWGLREGTFFWAFVNIPPVDGIHHYTAVAANAEGQQRSATVSFSRDTLPPQMTITSPPDGSITNESSVVIMGTVDDPEATVRLGTFGAQIPVIDGTFEVTVSLIFEGSNRITVSARDPSRNRSIARITIFRDTVPPVINITTPPEGAAVNTSFLPVEGTVSDSNSASGTATVNGGPPESLTLSGSFFSDDVTLTEGLNTIRIEAADGAGNVSSANRSVLLDTVPPAVGLTTPQPDDPLTGVITATVEASDASSGVAQVGILVDGEIQETKAVPPYAFDLDTISIPSGNRTLTAEASDRAGNSSEVNIPVRILPQIQLQIDSPADGSTLTQSPVLVRGTVTHNLSEVGITVNEMVALVNGGQFAVERVPLQNGINSITAAAADGKGLSVTAISTVTFSPGIQSNPQVSLETSSTTSVSPAQVTFNADSTLTNPVVLYKMDFEGDGSIDFIGSTFANVIHIYTNPGLFFPTITVTDSQGGVFTATTIINIVDQTILDTILKGKWNAMRNALSTGDIDKAVTYFVSNNQERYLQQFTALAPVLSENASDMGGISLIIDLGPHHAEYELRRVEDGVEISYILIFSHDRQGLWKIQWF